LISRFDRSVSQINFTEIIDEAVVFATDFNAKPLGVLPMALTLLAFIPAYMVIVWCFAKIYRCMKANRSSMSATTLQMQNNLLLALSIQSLLPAACVTTPGVNYIIYSFESNANDSVSQYISFILPLWLPVINPLLTILLIAPYRRALFALFRRSQSISPPISDNALFQKVVHRNMPTVQ
jgi:hypothetical protein